MEKTVRALPSADTRTRRVVRARRHAEGGGAAITLETRPDGLLALLVAGAGRGTALLDREGVDRLAAVVAGLRDGVAPAAEPVEPHQGAPEGSTWSTGHARARFAEPRPSGRGPERVGGRVVVPWRAHRAFCGFAGTGDRLDGHPDVQPCHGCGLGVRVERPGVVA